MNSEIAGQIQQKKDDIARLEREILTLSDGCGSWFQPAGTAEGIQCGHGKGHCPSCAKDALMIDDQPITKFGKATVTVVGQPVTGFAEGDEEIHVERDE